jgi:SAM-dependent methyltransferase
MSCTRALQWLAICSLAGWTACGSGATAPRPAIAHAGSQPPVAAASPAPAPAADAAEPQRVEPERVAEPQRVVESPAEQPPAEPPIPAGALVPCPSDRSRDERQKPDHVVHLVDLADSMTVVDLGSGSGYFLCRLSHAVGAHGHVIATEIDKNLVRDLKQRAAREQLANVEVVLAPSNDVGVPPAAADRILLVNVWHHLSDRKRYAEKIARALSPGGKVVIIDFKPTGKQSTHGILPDRVLTELAAGGIDGAIVPDELSDQYVIIGSVRGARTP